jgi:phosphopantothenoylcysteine decarboxylase/phosphopantothenate--cysteine ligase
MDISQSKSVKKQRVLLGITGGVAAYKTAELLRLMTKSGMDVRVVMTEAATRFIGVATLQALSGQNVYTSLWDPRIPDAMAHIELSRDRDVILVVPATANFMAKVANGLADDLLTTLCVARRCPLLVAPAMNVEMWENAATRGNVSRLVAQGIGILGPGIGEQACGETGYGRMLEPDQIFDALQAALAPKSLAGKRVLITAGPTAEPIDTVRVLTNLSSGKMGYAVAQAAVEAGADVTLVSGPTSLPTPAGVTRIDVRTAQQMHDTVLPLAKAADIFIAVAAVADYRPASASSRKLKRGAGGMMLELVPNPDILATVAALKGGPFCVGFAAETENLREYAQAKRKKKNIPLLAANLAQHAFGQDSNALTLFDGRGEHELPRASKLTLARQLLSHISSMLGKGSRKRK